MSKYPTDWPEWRSQASTRSAPASVIRLATSLAAMDSRPWDCSQVDQADCATEAGCLPLRNSERLPVPAYQRQAVWPCRCTLVGKRLCRNGPPVLGLQQGKSSRLRNRDSLPLSPLRNRDRIPAPADVLPLAISWAAMDRRPWIYGQKRQIPRERGQHSQ